MEQTAILKILNDNYLMRFDHLEFLRDAGSISYVAFADSCKYFLRVTSPVYFETALSAVDIHIFLQKQNFPVPKIIFTSDNAPCVRLNADGEERLIILYEFIEGNETHPEQDAEAVGALLGSFHSVMKSYPGLLVKRDKHYYIDKYIDILHQKQYPKANEFSIYGEALWEKVKNLPRGYSHGDMYDGNTHKTPDGRIYLLDFDTSCEGFPMYDIVLYCNKTHYFEFHEDGHRKTKNVFHRFLPEYLRYSSLSQNEMDAFDDFMALYHFALQAAVIERCGLDCVDNAFFDRQLDWLYRWRDQCEKENRRFN